MPAIKRPTELKLLEGRRVSGNPPQLAPLDQWRIPTTLRRRGRELWQRIVDGYKGTRVLQVTDRPALELLCMEYDLYHACAADVRKRGHIVPSARGDGDLVANPSVRMMHGALERWHRLAASFGLSPADRSRLDAPKVEEDVDPLQEIIDAANAERDAREARRRKRG